MIEESGEPEKLVGSGINPSLIKSGLCDAGINLPVIRFFYETDSTNTQAHNFAAQSEKDALFIADGQTAGRGRRGRNFASAHGAGIYMSFLLHPTESLADFNAVTAYAAVAVCRAIERVSTLSPEIKWVNDVYVGGKKCCGILTEGVLSDDMITPKHVICGIGINVKKTVFPEEIADIATSLEDAGAKEIDRNRLIVEVAREFLKITGQLHAPDVREEYKRRSFLLGREITVHKLGSSYPARVVSVGDDMSLRLKLSDGSEERLVTGEVSVREI